MKPEITKEQALNNLYQAARLAPLNAEQHEALRASAEILLNAIKDGEPKSEAKEKNKNEK